MAGWDLKSGSITEYKVSDDHIWSLFNYVFSDSSKKRNTYKFGFLKSILDNLFNCEQKSDGMYFSYDNLFAKFTENYWNLVLKYGLKQMKPDGKSIYSKVENILRRAESENAIIHNFRFDSIDDNLRIKIIHEVSIECRRNVVGALYNDFDGVIYSFDLKDSGIVLNPAIYNFMFKHKVELEKLNYYSWARFLEKVNDDNVLVRVIDKLELATPHRDDLSVYREVLRKEFEVNTCFYCGGKLKQQVHVDHFIPWSFVKDDKIWNFVLACSTCNLKKNNKLPSANYVIKIENRNKKMQLIDDEIVQQELTIYKDGLIQRMWNYAKNSGFKEFVN